MVATKTPMSPCYFTMSSDSIFCFVFYCFDDWETCRGRNRPKTKQIKKQFDNTCAAFYKAHLGHHTNGCLLTIKKILNFYYYTVASCSNSWHVTNISTIFPRFPCGTNHPPYLPGNNNIQRLHDSEAWIPSTVVFLRTNRLFAFNSIVPRCAQKCGASRLLLPVGARKDVPSSRF